MPAFHRTGGQVIVWSDEMEVLQPEFASFVPKDGQELEEVVVFVLARRCFH